MSTKTTPGTPSWLRAQNERTALALLLEHGALTRNRLGELSGLSKPTAGQIIANLEELGLVDVVGEVSGGRGPNAVSYGIRANRVLGVAVDIDDTVIRSTVVDATGTENPVVETPLDSNGHDRKAATDIREAIATACTAAHANMDAVRVVSIGVQGSIDPRTDELSFIDNLPGWPRKGVRAQLETALGRAVFIDNDVNLAAVAERSEGAGSATGSFALLWLGSGLGLAIDFDGRVHRGAAGGAGEIGYVPVPQSAAAIDPAAADLQDLLGGDAIAALAASVGATVSPAELAAALHNHPARHQILAAIAPRIALGIVPVLAILDPEVVVLGGPIGSAGGEQLAQLVKTAIQDSTPWHPDVVTSGIASYPVLRGARQLLVNQVRERLFDELG